MLALVSLRGSLGLGQQGPPAVLPLFPLEPEMLCSTASMQAVQSQCLKLNWTHNSTSFY